MFKKLSFIIIDFYQKYISLESGFLAKSGVFKQRKVCVFYPRCSEYTRISIEKYGFFIGVYKSIGRILRCHPWQKNHIDIP